MYAHLHLWPDHLQAQWNVLDLRLALRVQADHYGGRQHMISLSVIADMPFLACTSTADLPAMVHELRELPLAGECDDCRGATEPARAPAPMAGDRQMH
jgi:hypothetical protein